MRNLKLTIEYDGTNYAGWQSQGSRFKTIQQTIENALQKILQEKIRLISAGRTDSGVHAIGQVANFKTRSLLPLKNIKRALNTYLPSDIVIRDIEEVDLDFHSRYQAKGKLYRYTILNGPERPALGRDYFYFLPYKLDIGLMKKEARELLGRQNFQSFCSQGSSVKDTVRWIKHITIKKSPYHLKGFSVINIEISADGFLYNMVRNIAGTLIEIGRGRLAAGSLKKILLAKERRLAGPTLPAKGLALVRVDY